MVTLGFFSLLVLTTKFSGKVLGRTHQMPSVSSSRGLLEDRRMRHHWDDVICCDYSVPCEVL
ncbi:hypothetical protein EYF80_051417 [Liparis tanakae]|uniref:Uncharacterized protein n=1 Tax=Liparis tanakae TaxID=230148 RepID=A0A4Z2FB82_9TELE|nr:hypothetical protein EYF80_051417 [Liparis tanakae]